MNEPLPHFRSKDASAPSSQPEPPAPPSPGEEPAAPLHEAMRPAHLSAQAPSPASTAPPPLPTAGDAPLLEPPIPRTIAPEEETPWHVWVRDRLAEVPAWAVSFATHLVLLIVLALLVVKGNGPGGPLSLTLTMGTDEEEEGAEEEAVFEAPAGEEAAPEEEEIEEEEPVEEEIVEEEAPEEEAVEEEVVADSSNENDGGGTSSDGAGEGVAGNGTGAGGGSGRTGFMNIYDDFESVAYVVDCSGSMEGAKLEAAKYELIRSIESLGGQRKFIISFFDDIEYTYPQSGRLLEATQVNVDSARRWIMNIDGGGGTNPDRSLARAFRAEAQVVYFLTDGEVNNPDSTWAVIERYRPGRTIIHTIGFDSTLAGPFLREIAEDCGGQYRYQIAEDLIDPGRKPLIVQARVDLDELLPDIIETLKTGDEEQALLAAQTLVRGMNSLESEQVIEAGRALTVRLRMTDPGQLHFQFENALLALAPDDVSDVTNPDSWSEYWDSYAIELLERSAFAQLRRADALRRAGRIDPARRQYEDLIETYPGTPSAATAQATLDDVSLWIPLD